MSNSNARMNAIIKSLNPPKVKNALNKVERLLGQSLQSLFAYENALKNANNAKIRLAKSKMHDTQRRYENAKKELRTAQNQAYNNTRAKFGNW